MFFCVCWSLICYCKLIFLFSNKQLKQKCIQPYTSQKRGNSKIETSQYVYFSQRKQTVESKFDLTFWAMSAPSLTYWLFFVKQVTSNSNTPLEWNLISLGLNSKPAQIKGLNLHQSFFYRGMDWRLGNMEVSYQTRQCQKTSCCNFHWYSHYSQTKYVSDGLIMCKKRPTLTVIKAFSEFFRIEACNIAMKYRIFICYTTNGQHYSWQYLMYINVSLVCLAGSLQVGSNRKLRTQGYYYQKSFPPSLTELKMTPTISDPNRSRPLSQGTNFTQKTPITSQNKP